MKIKLRCALGAMWCAAGFAASASDTLLPDGTEFVFWERPLKFTKTYHVDPGGDDKNPGTRERPFRTISRAAEILQAGERVVIRSGVYRELVRPARGGGGPERMISYEAAPGASVVVSASELLPDGWQPSSGRLRDADEGKVRIWKHELTGAMFPDAYNPFSMANVPGDWSWLDPKRVDMGPYFRRRGMIFVDGKPLEPVEQYRELGNLPPAPAAGQRPRTGLPSRTRGGPIMQEIGGSPDGKFWVEHQGNVIHVRLPSNDPARSRVEITTREQAFAPRHRGLGFIRIKGITFQHAGNAFPPPQRGLVSTSGGHHWIIEGNTIEWANGVGLDIAGQDWNGSREPSAGDSHIVRGNTLRFIGVEGIGGMGTVNTLVEDNLIEWVGWQDAERAWEAAGVKFHRARNLLFRRNVIRHIRHANALWLDVGNMNCRITGNVFADVLTVSAGIHIEMSRAENQVDNNIIWDIRNAEPGTPGQRGAAGSGIFLHASDRQTIANNLIGRCDNVGVFPVFRDDRNGSGTGREHRIHDNIIAHCDKGGIVFLHEQNQADGNLYAGLPAAFNGLGSPDSIQWMDLGAWRSRGWDVHGAVASLDLKLDPDRLELTIDGMAALPRLPIFNGIDSDSRTAGPFVNFAGTRMLSIDPRKKSDDGE